MSESQTDALVRQYLDSSKFSSLVADAKKAANDPKVKAAAATADAPLERIRAYVKANPDNPLVKENQHLVPQAGGQTWSCGPGNISLTSAYAWALGGGMPFLDLVPLAFLFGGDGKSWGAWATFTSIAGGTFEVDPKTIPLLPEFKLVKDPVIGWVRQGPCWISLQAGAFGGGGCKLDFSRMPEHGGTYWGSVGGPITGAGGANFSGWVTMKWQGF